MKLFKKSLFRKLMLIIIFAGLFIHLIVGSFFRKIILDKQRIYFEKNLNIYADYLINDMGFPPDFSQAKKLSQNTMLYIAIKKGKLFWRSHNKNVNLKKYHFYHTIGNAKMYFKHNRFLIIKEVKGYTYYFQPLKQHHTRNHEVYFIIVVFLLTGILVLAYIFIKKQLKPIKLLTYGVKEIAKGNLETDVPILRNDELGKLTKSFNEMKNEIAHMLHSKKQLLLDVSHELRSPLTRMKVNLEFLEDNKIKDSLNDDIYEIQKMITEILETERLNEYNQALNICSVDIIQLIESVIENLKISKERIIIASETNGINIQVDEDKIKTVFKNIIENAYKYSNTKARPIEIFFKKEENQLNCYIKDYGAGIPKDDIPYIFEPFYRVDPSRSRETGGYGLGLSICKKIMDVHEGTITIESKLNEGTTIALSFKI